MQNPLHRADCYRQKAMKYHGLAKHAQFAFLGEFYRRTAVRYIFMADEILNEAGARGEIAKEDGEIWNLWRSPGRKRARLDPAARHEKRKVILTGRAAPSEYVERLPRHVDHSIREAVHD